MHTTLLLASVAAAALAWSFPAAAATISSPVVIIPGDGSNQLEAKLDKPSVPHFYCSKTSGWYRLWLSATQLLPGAVDCWADNIRLVVDETSGKATNAPGVTTRVPYWGTTDGFEELDPSVPGHATAAFYNMVQALTAAGYEKNATLRGAPYDFRYTPDSDPGYGVGLKALIEETVTKQGGAKVTLISHSMGGLQGLYFLRQQTQEWKDAHILRWIPISAPWAGAAKELRLMATGDNEGLPVSPSSLKDEQRSYETNHWLLPNGLYSSAFGNDTVLVKTNGKQYTTANYDEFFEAVDWKAGKAVYGRTVRLLGDVTKGPGVPVLCMYSHGVDTVQSLEYADGDFSKNPTVTNGDGDGTVNLGSLQVCDGWNATQTQPVEVMTYSKIDHSGMITDDSVIKEIVKRLGV